MMVDLLEDRGNVQLKCNSPQGPTKKEDRKDKQKSTSIRILLNYRLMNEIKQPLLYFDNKDKLQSTKYTKRLNRFSAVDQKYFDIQYETSNFQIETDQIHKNYYSIIQEPEIVWDSEEILERSLIMQQEPQISSQQLIIKDDRKHIGVKKSVAEVKSSIYRDSTKVSSRKKELNYRIFYMKKRPMSFLYYFNLFFNIMFRIGLVILLIELQVYGDGDNSRVEEDIFIRILLGLEGIVFLLYFLALTKILYTKSSDISVYFQKQFYEKPYAEIHLDRIMRKHFTFKKIVSNLSRLANPFNKFSKDIKISVMRQQIFKRIEIIIVYLPLLVSFTTGLKWFDKTDKNINFFDVKLLMAVLVCIETVHIMVHYLLVYIFS